VPAFTVTPTNAMLVESFTITAMLAAPASTASGAANVSDSNHAVVTLSTSSAYPGTDGFTVVVAPV
jgi:hypothetical protein